MDAVRHGSEEKLIEPDELRDTLMEDGADDCTNVADDIFQEVDTDKVKSQYLCQ